MSGGRRAEHTSPWPWRGEYIEVHQDGTWDWHACGICGQPLKSAKAKAKGYGPGCGRRLDLDDRPAIARGRLKEARDSDRQLLLAQRQGAKDRQKRRDRGRERAQKRRAWTAM